MTSPPYHGVIMKSGGRLMPLDLMTPIELLDLIDYCEQLIKEQKKYISHIRELREADHE